MSKIIKIFCVSIFLFASCANIQAPSGGPPDKTPPLIEENSPQSGTLNFKGESVKIKFNKYMNNNSVQENIFISPSVKMAYDWSGKEIEIEFEEPLDTNTTYALTLGTDYSDLKNNKPQQAFTIIFSTGSQIDSGKIQGTIFGEDLKGVYLFGYSLNGINPDTLNPGHTAAHYRSQPGSDGSFSFNALKDGVYRIFAVRDQYKDELYNEGSDDFGAAPYDIAAKLDSTPVIKLKLGRIIDKSEPMLYDAESRYNNLIIAGFNEDIDTNSLSPSAFSISDSAGIKNIEIISVFPSLEKGNKALIITKNPLDTAVKWRLSCSRDSIFGIKDLAGNLISDTMKSQYFFAEQEPDTTNPALLSVSIKDSTDGLAPKAQINFLFNTGIDTASFRGSARLFRIADTTELGFRIIRRAENFISVTAENEFQSEQWHKLTIDMKKIKTLSGKYLPDSLLTLRFGALDTRTYSGISGKLTGVPEGDSSQYLIVLRQPKGKDSVVAFVSREMTWSFGKLAPGDYEIELIRDSDRNGQYSYGDAHPFKPAERFIKYAKQITVKPRWNLDGVVLEWKE